MAFDDKVEVVKKDKGPSFGYPPEDCRCGCKAVVSLITVVNTNNGQLKTGAASEFCGRDNNNNPNWQLMDWYTFRHWSSYCQACWAGEKPQGQRKYTDDQVRVAFKWLLGEMNTKGGMDMGFSKVNLSNEQRDRAIEIVNYEAHRNGQPFAVPDEYKLAEVWA